MAMREPRSCRIESSSKEARLRGPLLSAVKRISPETRACGGSKRRIASEVMDLPDPDSPTSPSTSPELIEKLRSRTARSEFDPAASPCAKLRFVGKSIFSWRTSSSGSTIHGSSAGKKRRPRKQQLQTSPGLVHHPYEVFSTDLRSVAGHSCCCRSPRSCCCRFWPGFRWPRFLSIPVVKA